MPEYRDYINKDLEASLRIDFVDKGNETIAITDDSVRDEIFVNKIFYGLSRGLLKGDGNKFGKWGIFSYKLTLKGKTHFGISE